MPYPRDTSPHMLLPSLATAHRIFLSWMREIELHAMGHRIPSLPEKLTARQSNDTGASMMTAALCCQRSPFDTRQQEGHWQAKPSSRYSSQSPTHAVSNRIQTSSKQGTVNRRAKDHYLARQQTELP